MTDYEKNISGKHVSVYFSFKFESINQKLSKTEECKMTLFSKMSSFRDQETYVLFVVAVYVNVQ